MNTTGTPRVVIDFARAVRAHLSDLPEADVEDLTEGLEADLSERLADDGPELGDPVSYADELRHAAGLPPRVTTAPGLDAWWKRNADAASAGYARMIAKVRSNPAGDSAMDLLSSLRPVWWVIRGWVGYRVLALLFGTAGAMVPRSAFGWLMMCLLVVISVQWGRDKWMPRPWFRGLRFVANALAIVLLVPVLAYWMNTGSQNHNYENVGYTEPVGIVLDGQSVNNVFAYDCSGAPLNNVQLFDQDGNPLNAAAPGERFVSISKHNEYSGEDREVMLFPSRFVSGDGGWNVFPLQTAMEEGYAMPEGTDENVEYPPAAANLPFDSVQPLMGECRDQAHVDREPGMIDESKAPAEPVKTSDKVKPSEPVKPSESAKPGEKATEKPKPSETRTPADASELPGNAGK